MKSILAISTVIAGFLVACSSATESTPASANETSSAPTAITSDVATLPASGATTAAIGVTHWGASVDTDTTTIRGYDDDNSVLVTVTHVVAQPSSAQPTITDTVSGTEGSAALELQMTEGDADADGSVPVSFTMLKNSFTAGDGPSKVLAAALADQGDGSGWAEGSSVTTALGGSGVALGTESLHPNAPVPVLTSGGSTALVSCSSIDLACGVAVAKSAGKILSAGGSCIKLVKSGISFGKCLKKEGIGGLLDCGDLGELKDEGSACINGVSDAWDSGKATTATCGCKENAQSKE